MWQRCHDLIPVPFIIPTYNSLLHEIRLDFCRSVCFFQCFISGCVCLDDMKLGSERCGILRNQNSNPQCHCYWSLWNTLWETDQNIEQNKHVGGLFIAFERHLVPSDSWCFAVCVVFAHVFLLSPRACLCSRKQSALIRRTKEKELVFTSVISVFPQHVFVSYTMQTW